MFFSSRRPLLRALTASVLIHAALLSSAVSVFAPRLETLTATISVAINPAARHQPAPAIAAAPAAMPTAKPLPAPDKRAATIVQQAQAAERSAEPPAAASSAPPPGGEVAGAASSSPVAAPRVAASPNPAPARAGVSADDLRQYSMSLGIAARRFKRYPALARERGWEGRAEVALIFSAALPAPEIVLLRSSGRSVLDERAVEMMTQASRVASLPDGLKGRDFRLPQTIEFSLADNQ